MGGRPAVLVADLGGLDHPAAGRQLEGGAAELFDGGPAGAGAGAAGQGAGGGDDAGGGGGGEEAGGGVGEKNTVELELLGEDDETPWPEFALENVVVVGHVIFEGELGK